VKAILPKLLGLPLLGLIATVGFVFLTFPDDKAQLLVQRHVEKLLDYEYRVEASEFDVGIFSGLEMKSVNLTPRFTVDDDEVMGPEGGSGEPAARDPESLEAKYFCPVRVVPVPMMFDRIAFDPSLTSLLSGALEGTFALGNLEGPFALEAAGGTLEGELVKGEEGQTLKAKLDAIALQRFTLLRNKIGVHLVGQLFGDIDLQFGEGMSLAGGSIAMNLRGVVMCPKKFKVNMKNVPFLEMPLTRLGDLEGTVEVTKQRRLEFKDFKGEGEDMSLSVQGSIQLTTDRIPRTRYDLRIKLTPNDQWVEDNAMEILFKICRRFDDGSIQLVVSGEAGKVKKDCVKNAQGAPGGMPAPQTRRSPTATEQSRESDVEARRAEQAREEELQLDEGIVEEEGEARVTPPVATRLKGAPSLDRGVTSRPNVKGLGEPVSIENRRKVLDVYNH